MPELADQIQDFCWANAKMKTEYISTPKAAIIKIAQKLQDTETKDNLGRVNIDVKDWKKS